MDDLKSTPEKGAGERDWTNKILVLDLENSIGEKFHFEIEPNEKDTLSAHVPNNKTSVSITIPIT